MTTQTQNPETVNLWANDTNFQAGVVGLASLVVMVMMSSMGSPQFGSMLIHNTIRVTLLWYAASLVLMLRLSPQDWTTQTSLGKWTRWCWTWAVVSFLCHFVSAFHFYHHWSQQHAYEHVENVSGWGPGIFVSYSFTLLWTLDMIYWWMCPQRYAHRSSVLGGIIHTFLLFIIFNGTVVFEVGFIRVAGIIGFILFAVYAVWTRLTFRPATA